MKKSAEHMVKDLIRKYRLVCEQLNDCPVKKARQPSQLDCWVCILQDVEVMRAELKGLREFKLHVTMYGTRGLTKLEASLDSSLLPVLREQIGRASNGPR